GDHGRGDRGTGPGGLLVAVHAYRYGDAGGVRQPRPVGVVGYRRGPGDVVRVVPGWGAGLAGWCALRTEPGRGLRDGVPSAVADVCRCDPRWSGHGIWGDGRWSCRGPGVDVVHPVVPVAAHGSVGSGPDGSHVAAQAPRAARSARAGRLGEKIGRASGRDRGELGETRAGWE